MRNLSFRLILPALVLVTAGALPVQAAVDTYKIDGVHSNISFKVRHLMSKVQGRFGKAEGVVNVDTQDITKSSVDVTIAVASVSTNEDKRDAHLRSADFFDAEKFPAITFKSTSVREVSKGMLEVTGTFTMKGVSKTLVLPITNLGTSTMQGTVIAGFEGAIKINRQDYGVSYGKGLIGDDVEIELNVEAKKTN